MDSHGLHRRQPHSALRKKRFQPSRLPGLHDLGLENNVDSAGSKQAEPRSLQERQFFSTIPELPGFTIPVSDIFPPILPTRSSSTESPAPPTPTPPTLPSPDATSTEATSSTDNTSSTATPTTPTTTTNANPTPTPNPTTTTTSNPTTSISRVVVTEDETAVLTSFFGTSTSGSATPSSTTLSSKDSEEDSNTGPIVGGIVAGVIALAVLVIALVWWIRRRNREKIENDITPFNPHDFRRSAVLINDEPQDGLGTGTSLSRGPTFNRGGDPRPPSMIERKLAHTPMNGYDGGFASYPSSHGHGEQLNGVMPAAAQPMPLHYYDGGAGQGYGYGAGVGAGGASYGFNQYQVSGEQLHYSGAPSEGYGLQHGAGPQNVSYAPGQVVDPNMQNPFMTPVQSSSQMQSPFSPPSSAHGDLTENFTEQGNTAVLAQVGGAAVLTRSISTKSKHSGKSNLSISIPQAVPVNAKAVNGSADSTTDQNAAVDNPPFRKQGSDSSASISRSGSMKKSNVSKAPPPALPITEEYPLPSSDYVDLSRSSVSPFQAAQYAEISRRLNAEVPQGLPNTVVDEYVSTRDRDLPPLPPTQSHNNHRSSTVSNTDSMSSSTTGGAPNMMDFPIPPPSPLAAPSRHSIGRSSLSSEYALPKLRVDSLPPQLPEINVASSSNNHDSFLNPPPGMSVMMSMGLNSAKDSPIYPSGITAGASPFLGNFPVTPSPLGMTFDLETPNPGQGPNQGDFAMQQEAEKGPVQQQQPELKLDKGKQKERPMTVYDEDDAYGGI